MNIVSIEQRRTARERARRFGDMAKRIDVSHRVVEFAKYLLDEGFEADDIVDALFRAAARRIGDKVEYLDWAADVGGLELDEPDIPVPGIEGD